ncbi:MAG: cupin domain-containing protein, partial [Beijerinckiaceae bacterium]|nr:cupin domain-containing protein [Beijerinckiaceae bacterium]
MDPLSDVLSLLKLRSYVAGGFDMGGQWSVQFPRHDGIKCYALVSGQCWLSLDGVPDPVRVKTGDCFLLPRGRSFRLASDLALKPIDALALFPSRPTGG